MKYSKSLIVIVILNYCVSLTQAHLSNYTLGETENDVPSVELLKAGQDILKLRFDIVDLNMGTQNRTLFEINQKLTIFEENFAKLFALLMQQGELLKKLQAKEADVKPTVQLVETATIKTTKFDNEQIQPNATEIHDLEPNPNKSLQKINNTDNLFETDIREKDEPKICKLNGEQKLVCSSLSLATMCADSNSINCLNGKCRIKNSIYGEKSFWVSCDGEWTVIQRRLNGSVDFYRNWADYKRGFGDLDGEFWIGLDKLHSLTKILGPVELHIQLQDFDNVSKYAVYDAFAIGNEAEKYRMVSKGRYYGNAGSSLEIHSGQYFSTHDKDSDQISSTNCASKFQGGWWYYQCNVGYDFSNLNGHYYDTGIVPSDKLGSGICWKTFRGDRQSMKFVEMKIRPRKQ